MLSRDVWAEVRRLHARGVPIKQIARDEGLAPNSVRRLVRAQEAPRYQRPPRPLLIEPFEARVLQLLGERPWLTAADIGYLIKWPASMSLLRAHVARLRAQAPLPATTRPLALEVAPGWAECGLWWPAADVAVGYGQQRRCPVLLMVAGHSGRLSARLLVSGRFADVWTGHQQLFQDWGFVPHTLHWDAAGIVEPPYWDERGGWSAYTAQAELGSTAVQRHDGGRLRLEQLEMAREYLQQACVSDRFTSPDDFARALRTWVDRFPGTRSDREARWAVERGAVVRDHPQPLLGLPMGDRFRAVPDAEGFVGVRGNGYLVGEWGARRRLTIELTETTVTVRSSGYHAGGFHVVTYTRVWAEGVRVTDPIRHSVVKHGTSTEQEVDGP